MVAPYTQLFFHFAFLFSTYFTFVSEQSIVSINLGKKEIKIEYLDLKTPKEVADQAGTGLMTIYEASAFDERYASLKLISKEIFKQRKKLNAALIFSYRNQDDAFELLSIFRNPDGNLTHPILENEKIISSNGELIKEENFSYLEWGKDTPIIELKVKHGKLEEKHLLDMIGLEKYWKE